MFGAGAMFGTVVQLAPLSIADDRIARNEGPNRIDKPSHRILDKQFVAA
jgi:hypothetical protein